MAKDAYGFRRPNQHTADRIGEILKHDEYEVLNHEVAFLQKLCTKLYAEETLMGDEQRNIAQALDTMLERLLKEK